MMIHTRADAVGSFCNDKGIGSPRRPGCDRFLTPSPGTPVHTPGIYTLIPLFLTVIVLGLDPLAAALTGYLFTFYGLFQHWNIRTPRWLGYFIQRPESHLRTPSQGRALLQLL
jgi:hypothetical protein